MSHGPESHLFTSRLARLRHGLAINAPDVMVAAECALVVRAYYGSLWQAVWAQVWERIAADVSFWAMRLRVFIVHDIAGVHLFDAEEPETCWVCEGRALVALGDSGCALAAQSAAIAELTRALEIELRQLGCGSEKEPEP